MTLRGFAAAFCFLWPNVSVASDDVYCMAEAIYFESRNQTDIGQLAVAVVIRNRMDHPDYPDTACKVARQGRLSDGRLRRHQCQFSYYCDGKPETFEDLRAWRKAINLARITLEAQLEIVGLNDATHYHATYVQPDWASDLEPCTQIGDHRFYTKP